VAEVARGSNGIVFRAKSATQDLAAKVSQIDGRGRAGRELEALTTIWAAGHAYVPRPLGVVREGSVDVLITAWCDDEPLPDSPPPAATAWGAIAEAYAAVHGIPVGPSLEPTVLGVDLAQVVEDMRGRLRLFDCPTGEAVAIAAERSVPPGLPPSRRSLVHCEASLRNFLGGTDGSLTIVDWENSGLGDPCFDPANLVMAPQHARHELMDWDELFVRHATLLGDVRLAQRTHAHARVMAAWWVIRLQQELAAPTPRLKGVASPARELLAQRLAACEERAAKLLRAS
jgi:aminoglycoside phosphotransferase (APT) family kinase protein